MRLGYGFCVEREGKGGITEAYIYIHSQFTLLPRRHAAGCRLGLQGATELAMGVRLGGGWPFLRRIDLRNNLISSAVRACVCPHRACMRGINMYDASTDLFAVAFAPCFDTLRQAFTRLAEAFCAAPSGVSAAAATKTGHANAHGSSRSRHRTACSPRHDDDDEDDGEAAPLPPYCPPPRLEEVRCAVYQSRFDCQNG